MAYEHRESQGTLFRNDKGDNDRRPDFRGTIMLGGVVYKLSGWTKDGARGKFISLKGEPDSSTSDNAPF